MDINHSVHEDFDPACVAFSYGLACLGSLTAVVLMDCRRQVMDSRHQRLLLVAAAVALGGCGIWAMHFMGMTALKLTDETGREYPVSYEPIQTVGSLLVAVVFVYLGLEVASRDKYFGKDVEQRVAKLQESLAEKDVNVRTGGRAFIEHEALYSQLQWLIAGGVLAACGICIMHYEGMVAMRVNLKQEWHIGMVALSGAVAVTAGSTAFWILFRVLEWKPHLNYLRLVAALLMGVAVCGLHYTGMHAAIYSAFPESASPALPGGHGSIITKWAVGAEVMYCVMCIFFVYTRNRNDERTRTREVDKMYLSLVAVSTELVSTSVGGSHSPPHNTVTTLFPVTGVSNAERERALQFVSHALRFVLAFNSKRRDADVEAVEQDMLRVLRAGAGGGSFSLQARGSSSQGSPSIGPPRMSDIRVKSPSSDVIVPRSEARLSNMHKGEGHAEASDARASPSDVHKTTDAASSSNERISGLGSTRGSSDARASDAGASDATVSDIRMSTVKVHPISPGEREGSIRFVQTHELGSNYEAALSSSADSAPLPYGRRTSRAGSPNRSSLADSPLARLLALPPVQGKPHRQQGLRRDSSVASSGSGMSEDSRTSTGKWSSGRASDLADEV